MFEYFDHNYAWNLTAISLMDEIGNVTQPCEVFAAVKPSEQEPLAVSSVAWYDAMTEMGDRMAAFGDADLAAGNALTASRKFHRAATYFARADRIMPHDDPRQMIAYHRLLTTYRQARELGRDGVEFVEIPYAGGHIPGLLVTAAPAAGAPAPIVVHLQGFDSIKETQFPMLQEYRRRGLSLLIVDQPGAGGALRLHQLTGRFDSEAYVSVIIDWIMARPDLATDRIGLCGLSMGGYFAPRAAAFEPRVKAVAAWGALYSARRLATAATNGGESAPSVPSPLDHARWVFGASTLDELADVLSRLDLDGVVEQITCPVLVMHGELDRQVPLAHAQRMVERVTVADKTLKVFTEHEGGAQHCQVDNRAIAADYAADWFASRLGGGWR